MTVASLLPYNIDGDRQVDNLDLPQIAGNFGPCSNCP